MTITTAARGAALVALFAVALPAPASAQFGFIKKQLKNKIVNAVVDSAASKVFGPADSAGGKTPGTSAAAGATRATRTGAAAEGPQFDEFVVEITPRSLDGLEQYLTDLKSGQQTGGAAARASAHASQKQEPSSIVQYSLMTQRVVAFCAAAASSGKGGAALGALAGANGLYKSYTPTEIAALRPRCARLTALMGEGDEQ